MNSQLKAIAQSYDRAIELGKNGVDLFETSMGRPDKFDMSIKEFEDILRNLFEVERREETEGEKMHQI